MTSPYIEKYVSQFKGEIMTSLIVYESKHGCTLKCAERLKGQLQGDIEMVRVKHIKSSDIAACDTIIIGGSIHAGRIQGSIAAFCRKNLPVLKTKKVGLFLCCMEEGDKGEEQFRQAFPDELKSVSTVNGLFGGAFYFDNMNFLEKAIIKKISGTSEDVEKINDDEIKRFAEVMNS